MVDITVRIATRKDFPVIRALIRDVHINPTGLDWRHFLVATSPENKILGCGQIKPHFDGSRELASIAVEEQARGKGVARAVIQELLARERMRPLYLMCRSRLESFYNIFEFQKISQNEMPLYFQCISRVEHLLNSRAHPEDRLSVMRLMELRNEK
jgi:N-acetylglutamate synthase-like GNAT family acetyltransferase